MRHGSGRWRALVLFLATAAFLPAAPLWAREKVDRVTLLNGDHLMGEIKKVDRGVVDFRTDSLGRVYIEWEDVARLVSPFTYQVETHDGTRYFGTLGEPSSEGWLKIEWAEAIVAEVKLIDVVRVDPISQTFWSRVDGSLNLGYSFTKSSGVTTLSYSGDATYRQRDYEVSLEGSAITTEQETGTTSNQDYSLSYRRYFGHRWFSQYVAQAQSNSALGLELRGIVAAGLGRNLIQGNRATLSLTGGLAYTTEKQVEGEARADTEVLVSLQADIFRFKDPKLDLDTAATYFYSIDTGRLRGDFDLTLSYEIIKDFVWSLDFYDSYTSEPPSEESETNDYGVVTSVGYSF